MVDLETGAALLRWSYEDLVSCVCVDSTRFARIALPQAALEAVEQRTAPAAKR